jgi:tRNA dimethylallyltransferase
MSEKQKLVFIVGPTGVGKTDLAVKVAADIGEIISVDSMQVYRFMDCGTAKPDDAALARVRHHLVSIVPPDYRFSAGDFRRRALAAIDEMGKSGKLPILVGGTGLYFRALEYNLSRAPAASTVLRQRLYRDEEKHSGTLYKRLMEVDPDTATSLHPNDLVRIVRALEIYELSGTRQSLLKGQKPNPDFDILKIGLMIDRDALYRKLESRCMYMIEAGLPREVFSLLRRGYDESCPSMKGLGYSHFIQYFKGCVCWQETIRLFTRDTRRYAKRQLTWFSRDEAVSWYSPEQSDCIGTCIREFADS